METLVGGNHLRRLGFDDLAGVQTHLLSLDMVSRNRRFHCGFSDAAVTAYASRFDPINDILFGAIEPVSNRVVGLAEARAGCTPRTVDLGVSVLEPQRRRGIGHQLSARVVEFAFATGSDAVELVFDPENLAAQRIAVGLGARFHAPGRAVVHAPASLETPAGDPQASP
jgi:ribosomal protein S18 acetylase RimI-like enzyme